MFPDADTIWSLYLSGINDSDIQSYIDDYGLTPETPTDAKLKQDVTKAKTAANASGNTKLSNTLDFILKYGDKAVSILAKAGVLGTQNLTGYSVDLASTDVATSAAPTTSTTVFGIDFSDKKTLIIIGLLVAIAAYFLFFYRSKKRRK